MKKQPKRIIVLFCVVFLSLSVVVQAITDSVKTLEAHYSGISLVVNGVEVIPKDATGKIVEPFIVDGTTYLPVRAVANALEQEVSWDGETRTVYIGDIPGQETNWMVKLPPYEIGCPNGDANNICRIYDGSNKQEFFTVNGVNQTVGVTLAGYSSGIGGYRAPGYALWNTNALYKSMTLKVGHLDGYSKKNGVLEVYRDGEYYQEYELTWDGPIQTLTIPLNYCANFKLNLRLLDESEYGYSVFGMFDINFQS